MQDDINDVTFIIGGTIAPLARASMPAELFGASLADQLQTLDAWESEVTARWQALAKIGKTLRTN